MANLAKKDFSRAFNTVTMPAIKVNGAVASIQNDARNRLRERTILEAAENPTSKSAATTGFINRHVAHLPFRGRIQMESTDCNHSTGRAAHHKMKALRIEIVAFTAARLAPRLPEHSPT